MLKIRLKRMGSRQDPFYRVVVSDSRRTPQSGIVESLGTYNPSTNPATVMPWGLDFPMVTIRDMVRAQARS